MYEKTLLEESNRSLQASQVVRGRYDLLMTGQGSPRLPHLAKYRKATTTANSELLAQWFSCKNSIISYIYIGSPLYYFHENQVSAL